MADVGRITELWRAAADALERPRDPLHGWEASEIENARLRAECGRLREQLSDRERGFAKLVLLAHERGDEYWQDQLQIVGDFTLAEARAALGVEGEQE